jgi:hypothetical protein
VRAEQCPEQPAVLFVDDPPAQWDTQGPHDTTGEPCRG